jgi:hypothetical protein
MMWWVLSARIRSLLFLGAEVGFERGDDVVEVAQDLLVHLGQALLAACLGGGDDLQDLLAVFASSTAVYTHVSSDFMNSALRKALAPALGGHDSSGRER